MAYAVTSRDVHKIFAPLSPSLAQTPQVACSSFLIFRRRYARNGSPRFRRRATMFDTIA